MSDKNSHEKVNINFESHPPIEDDLDGIATLLRQTFFQFVDCHSLSKHLIQHKDLTQVIAQEEPDEENSDEDDEPDNDIYGVCSVIELPLSEKTSEEHLECRKRLLEFIKDKSPKFKDFIEAHKEGSNIKCGLIINERYINLPPQLSLPTLKTLTKSLNADEYTHLVLVSKILVKSKNADPKLPSKRSRFGQSNVSDAEPLIFVNPEEEIISEESEYFSDMDVSAHCDENASWSFGSDIKYIPNRRFLTVDVKKWPNILEKLEEELA